MHPVTIADNIFYIYSLLYLFYCIKPVNKAVLFHISFLPYILMSNHLLSMLLMLSL